MMGRWTCVFLPRARRSTAPRACVCVALQLISAALQPLLSPSSYFVAVFVAQQLCCAAGSCVCKPDVLDSRVLEHAATGKLLQHFRQPFKQDQKRVSAARDLCESGFEFEMFDALTKRGYRVRPQVPCGGYRIDFVVEGNEGRRLCAPTIGVSTLCRAHCAFASMGASQCRPTPSSTSCAQITQLQRRTSSSSLGLWSRFPILRRCAQRGGA